MNEIQGRTAREGFFKEKIRQRVFIGIFLWLGSLAVVAQENSIALCSNGIDDDGDGYIDCFDGECASLAPCDNFYYNQSTPSCQGDFTRRGDFELQPDYKTDEINYPIDQRSGLVVGDMDGDGIAEIVAKNPGNSNVSGGGVTTGAAIQIFNGEDGSIAQHIVAASNHSYSGLAIGDVDSNGDGDIFMMGSNQRLYRYEYDNPTNVWQSDVLLGGTNMRSATPHLADFDEDGTPEVYVGRTIINSLTGIVLINADNNVASSGRHLRDGDPNSTESGDRLPIAFDLFQNGDPIPGGGTFGSEADGMELIVGNQVYTVDIPNDAGTGSNSIVLAAEITTADIVGVASDPDGFTSIADLDGDDEMDIIVVSNGRVYAWNPRTESLMTSMAYDIPGTSRGGRANLGDFDNDGAIEIGLAGFNRYQVLEYVNSTSPFIVKWEDDNLDDASQLTGSTLFDFEGDGKNEVVYSEEESLIVYDGETGARLAEITSRSGTRSDYPLVADVDGDGQSEIVLTAQDENGPSDSYKGYVSVFKSISNPWVSARSVWNQHGYYITNVNSDLTIPQEVQNPLLIQFDRSIGGGGIESAFNSFMAQSTILTEFSLPTYAAADAIAAITNFTVDAGGVYTITYDLSNDAGASLPLPVGMNVSFWKGDPDAGGTLIGFDEITSSIPVGGSVTGLTYDFSGIGAVTDVFVIANNRGVRTGSSGTTIQSPNDYIIAECDYTNNIATQPAPTNVNPQVDLNGPDELGFNHTSSFIASGGPRSIVQTADAEVLDTDGDDITQMVVTLTNRPDGTNEILNVDETTGGITGITKSYDPSTGILTLSGTGTLAEYQSILRTLTYNNTTGSPDMADRIIEVVVTDVNTLPSNTAIATVEMFGNTIPITDLGDDGPDSDDVVVTYTEEDTPISLMTGATLTDTDNGGINFPRLTITVSDILDGNDEVLYIDGESIPLGGSQAKSSGTFDINYDATTGEIVITRSGGSDLTEVQIENILNGITYDHEDDDNPTDGDRILSIVVNDGTTDGPANTVTINVDPVNDPPATDLGDDGIDNNDSEVTYTESDAPVDLMTSPTITDVDDDTFPTMTIALAGVLNGDEEVLNIDGTDVPLGSDLAATTTTNGFVITKSGSTITITLSGGGEMDEVALENLLEGITYDHTNDDDPTDGDRILSIAVSDGDVSSPINTVTIDVDATNDPPVTDLNGPGAGDDVTVTFTEEDSPLDLMSSPTITDGDDDTFSSLTITLTGVQDGDDEVLVIDGRTITLGSDQTETGTTGGFDIDYDESTGVITITNNGGGEMDETDLEALLDGITYEHTDDDDPTDGDRVLSIVVNDSDTDSPANTVTINVDPVNDPPVTDLGNAGPDTNDAEVTYIEGDAATDLMSSPTITDVDDTTYPSMTITVTGVQDGDEEELVIDGQIFTLGSDQIATATTNGFEISYVQATGVITITNSGGGEMNETDLEVLLDGITYEHANDDNPSPGDRILSVVVNDGDVDSQANTVTITVESNDPPVATEGSYTINNDETLSDNLTSLVTDPEGDNLTFSLVGSGPDPATEGTLSLNPDGSYTFVPVDGFSGTTSFTYEVCDDGVPSECDQAEVTIIVNDNNPPVATPTTIVVDTSEGVSGTATSYVTDPNDDNLTFTLIEGPSSGTFTLNPDGSFTYVPEPGFVGTVTVTYEVCDDGTPVLCDQSTLSFEVPLVPGQSLISTKVITFNGDGINDYLKILGIENFPNNEVKIFNRWGNEVWSIEGYDNDMPSQRFEGGSNTGVIGNSSRLPDGTYYYVIDFGNGRDAQKDFVVIKR